MADIGVSFLAYLRLDLGCIWMLWLRKTASVAGYVEDFTIEQHSKMTRR